MQKKHGKNVSFSPCWSTWGPVKLQVYETFSEEAGNYFSKIKSAVRKSVQIQWSAGFEILPWRRTAGIEEHLSRQTMRKRAQTVFIISWDDSTGRCRFLCILCWPFTLRSSLFSCDLQQRSQEQVIKSPALLQPLEIQRSTGYPECQSVSVIYPVFVQITGGTYWNAEWSMILIEWVLTKWWFLLYVSSNWKMSL